MARLGNGGRWTPNSERRYPDVVAFPHFGITLPMPNGRNSSPLSALGPEGSPWAADYAEPDYNFTPSPRGTTAHPPGDVANPRRDNREGGPRSL